MKTSSATATATFDTRNSNPVLRALGRLLTFPARRTRRTVWKIRKRIYRPSFGKAAPTSNDRKLLTLGTVYGGWTFVDQADLHGSTIISCGLGTDGSFDIEFAARYQARVLIVDPTPKAIQHFKDITGRLRQPATSSYSQRGNQAASAYDLSALTAENLELEPKALWSEIKKVRFYAPPGDGVSYSIGNYLNDYRDDTACIDVDTTTLDKLMETRGIADIPLLKLDIEGAEIEVILHMMKQRIYPRQLLVEYDELSRPSVYSRHRIESAHQALLANGYTLVHDDGRMNFSYIRE